MALDGTYDIVVTAFTGSVNGRLVFNTNGGTLTGTSEASGETVELLEGVANGNEFKFKVKQKTPLGRITVTFSGTVDGDTITGNAKTPLFSEPLEGHRVA